MDTTLRDIALTNVSEFDHDLQEHEEVCQVTGYVYFKGLHESPHIDEEGNMVW